MTKYRRLSPMLACLLFLIGCGHSPTAPSQAVAAPIAFTGQTWACSGQSNASALCGGIEPTGETTIPALGAYATVIGSWGGGASIVAWDDTAADGQEHGWLWLALRDSLQHTAQPVKALIFLQREADICGVDVLCQVGHPIDEWWDNGNKGAWVTKMTSLVARVRRLTSPTLPVLLVQLGPSYQGYQIEREGRDYVASDPHARYIETSDIPYRDGIHMTDAGYQQAAARIAQALR